MEERENERNFEGIWIPSRVYLSQEVCWTAKIIFIEIHSFTSNGKECFISNERLAEFMNISATQVSKHISALIKIGWIEQVSFDGRRRVLRSLMTTDFKAAFNLTSRQPLTKLQGSHELKLKDTNTVTKQDTIQAEEGQEYHVLLQHMNAATGKKYKGDGTSRGALNARLKEGYTLAQIKAAITAASKDKYHREKKYQYLTMEYILRPAQLDRWVNMAGESGVACEVPVSERQQIGWHRYVDFDTQVAVNTPIYAGDPIPLGFIPLQP